HRLCTETSYRLCSPSSLHSSHDPATAASPGALNSDYDDRQSTRRLDFTFHGRSFQGRERLRTARRLQVSTDIATAMPDDHRSARFGDPDSRLLHPANPEPRLAVEANCPVLPAVRTEQ